MKVLLQFVLEGCQQIEVEIMINFIMLDVLKFDNLLQLIYQLFI
jgi:hypothetical protein